MKEKKTRREQSASRADTATEAAHPTATTITKSLSEGGNEKWWLNIGLIKEIGEDVPNFARENLTELYVNTAVLMMALEGEKPDFKSRFGVYLRYVTTEEGLSLAICAGEARKRGPTSWAAFCASLKLEGVQEALAGWTLHARKNRSRDAIEGYRQALLDNPVSDDEFDFYRWLRHAEVGEGIDVMPEFFAVAVRFDEARKKARKRKQIAGSRSRKAKNDPFRIIVERDWLIEALWCRPTKVILNFLPEKSGEDTERACKRIDRKISALGLAKTRRPQHDRVIAGAVKNLLRQIGKPP